MIITRTPMRISFFGGGTDFPEFFQEHGGVVLSTSFDKYCYVTVRHLPRFFSYVSEFCYSEIERVTCTENIRHPLIREAMKYLNMHEIRLTYEADLPARSGLGTSSSFAVGMLYAFHSLKGQFVGKRQLADEAIFLERILCDEAGGIQDQIAASFGGFNKISFGSRGYQVDPLIMAPERSARLNDNLLLFFTGLSRNSFEIQKSTRLNLETRRKELEEMKMLTSEAEKILVTQNDNLDEFGRLLHHQWCLKKKLSNEISTDYIDDIYNRARNAGALGGKLLGAGGGGFILFYVRQENRKSVLQALPDLMNVPFRFEDDGTKVIYYSPETYIPKEEGGSH